MKCIPLMTFLPFPNCVEQQSGQFVGTVAHTSFQRLGHYLFKRTFLAVRDSSLPQAEGLTLPSQGWPRELQHKQTHLGPSLSSQQLSCSHLVKGFSRCPTAGTELAEKRATVHSQAFVKEQFPMNKTAGWDPLYLQWSTAQDQGLLTVAVKSIYSVQNITEGTDIWYNFLQISQYSLLYTLPKYLQPSAFDWKLGIGLPLIIFNSLNR